MEAIFYSPYYTRYILPGLVFIVLFVLIPLLILNSAALRNWGIAEVTLIAIAILSSGYLLDVTGAYGWLNPAYRKNRQQYFMDVAKVVYPPDSIRDEADARSKSEVVLARFWARCPEDYQKLIEEPRAKWVLALHSAFLCRLSSLFWASVIIVQLIFCRAEMARSLWRPFVEMALMVGLLWLGGQLSKRGLTLAKLSDATAIALLNDKRNLLTEDCRPSL
ncbi:MAG: hypothetical protein ABIM43_07310 [candidate division WOR-3 bacterium]